MKNKAYKEERAQAIMSTPTPYFFNLKDIPMDRYGEVLNELFSDPKFKEVADKRNRFVKSVAGMRSNSSEINNIIRQIQAHDRKLADMVFAIIVQTNLHSTVTYESVPLDSLFEDVDYSVSGLPERVERLKLNLDKLVFLTDMLEGIIVDVKEDMEKVFDGKQEFKQFDAVRSTMMQIRGFFGEVRSKDCDSPGAQLYIEYSDSINDYLTKRLKTYSEKLRRIKSK